MNKSKGFRIRKFNPGTLQTDRDVIEQFVVRKHELHTVLDILRGNIKSPSCQHSLVVARRGQGKTMLLARIAAELRVNEEFSKTLLPVRFMEENLGIFNMADFWLETLFQLALECAKFNSEIATELHETHSDLSERWSDRALEGSARAAVLDAADRLGCKIVLMVENFQSLREVVDKDFGWKLREVLQTESQIMLVGSATIRFDGLDDAAQPFFELFRIIDLKPLNTNESRLLWEVVCGEIMSDRQMRPIEILTGGSPRLVVIVAEFAQHKSVRLLMDELVRLIDEHTEYFRGHLEGFSGQQRRVYLAVIDLWRPSTPGEISDRARMDIRNVSTMLKRLVTRGVVTARDSGRKWRYVATERLYSIYYKLRRERDEAAVVKNLIRFMAVFYSETEQSEVFSVLIEEAAESAAIRDGLDRAVAENPELNGVLARMYSSGVGHAHSRKQGLASDDPKPSASVTMGSKELREQIRAEILGGLEKRAFKKVIGVIDHAMTSHHSEPSGLPGSFAAWLLIMKARAQEQLADLINAVSTYDDVAARYGTSTDVIEQYWAGIALIRKGFTLWQQGDIDSAVSTYEEAVERFGTMEDQELQELVALALINKGEILKGRGDLDSAVSAFEEVIDRIGAMEVKELQIKVTEALINKGEILKDQGESDPAVSVNEEVVERIGTTEVQELQELVALALINKGEILLGRGHLDSAVSAFEEIVERFGTTEVQELQIKVAEALTNKGDMLKDQGHLDSAVSAFEEIVERFGTMEVQELQIKVAEALTNKGDILKDQGESNSAMSVYQEVVDRFGTSEILGLQIKVAFAYCFKATVLFESGDLTSAESAIGKAVELLATREDAELNDTIAPLLQVFIALELNLKGLVLLDQGDLDSAVSTYEEVVERFGTMEEPELQKWVVIALVGKTELLTEMGRTEDALDTYAKLKRRLSVLNVEEKNVIAGIAMCVGARMLMARNDLRAAIESFRLLYDVFDPIDETMMREVVILAIELASAGVAARDLVEILSSDSVCEAALTPLLVALRQEAGESVRAPDEILDVAADIRESIQKK